MKERLTVDSIMTADGEYLLNEIAEDAQDMLNAIGDKDVDEIDDEEVLCFCHSIATTMTALETVAMVGRLVPWFLGDKGCEGE